jgi:hypothetical protein
MRGGRDFSRRARPPKSDLPRRAIQYGIDRSKAPEVSITARPGDDVPPAKPALLTRL